MSLFHYTFWSFNLLIPKLNDYYNEHQDPFSQGMNYSSFFYVFIYLACLIDSIHIFYPQNDLTIDQNVRTDHFEKLVVVTSMRQCWKLLHDSFVTAMRQSWKLLHTCYDRSLLIWEVVTTDNTSSIVIRLLQHLLIGMMVHDVDEGQDFILMISNEQSENWGFSGLLYFWTLIDSDFK